VLEPERHDLRVCDQALGCGRRVPRLSNERPSRCRLGARRGWARAGAPRLPNRAAAYSPPNPGQSRASRRETSLGHSPEHSKTVWRLKRWSSQQAGLTCWQRAIGEQLRSDDGGDGVGLLLAGLEGHPPRTGAVADLNSDGDWLYDGARTLGSISPTSGQGFASVTGSSKIGFSAKPRVNRTHLADSALERGSRRTRSPRQPPTAPASQECRLERAREGLVSADLSASSVRTSRDGSDLGPGRRLNEADCPTQSKPVKLLT
jgi:hypothetical protein